MLVYSNQHHIQVIFYHFHQTIIFRKKLRNVNTGLQNLEMVIFIIGIIDFELSSNNSRDLKYFEKLDSVSIDLVKLPFNVIK